MPEPSRRLRRRVPRCAAYPFGPQWQQTTGETLQMQNAVHFWMTVVVYSLTNFGFTLRWWRNDPLALRLRAAVAAISVPTAARS